MFIPATVRYVDFLWCMYDSPNGVIKIIAQWSVAAFRVNMIRWKKGISLIYIGIQNLVKITKTD